MASAIALLREHAPAATPDEPEDEVEGPTDALDRVPDAQRAMVADFLTTLDQAMPGRLVGLLLHGPGDTERRFVALWDELPQFAELVTLSRVHHAVHGRHGAPFDGFHATADDLASDPLDVEARPMFLDGEFHIDATVGLDAETWRSIADSASTVRALPRTP